MRVAWAGLAALTVSFGLNFSAGVFFSPVADSYGISGTTLAVAAGASTALTGLLQPVIGALLDRAGARAVLLTGLALIASSYLALASVRETWQFVAAYVILGGTGFAASSSHAVSTLIGRSYGDRAGPALAKAALGITLGQLIAPWLATTLFGPVGVRGAYLTLGLTGLAATAALASLLPTDPGRPVDLPGRAAVLPKRPRLLASFGLHSATLYALVLLLPKYATELGWPAVAAGRLVAVSAVAAGITTMLMARLLGRYRPETLLRVLHLVRALALALAATATGPRMLLAAAVIFGAASFTVVPLTMAALTRGADLTRLGRTLAPAWVVHQLSAGLGLAVAAGVHALSGGYRGYFALGVVLSLTAAALITSPSRDPHQGGHRNEHPAPHGQDPGTGRLLPRGGRPGRPHARAAARLPHQLGDVP